jgi:hypothetical protein
MYDLTPALVHGSIVHVMERAFQASHNQDEARDIIRKMVDDFDPLHDSILWCGGDVIALMITAEVLLEFGIREFYYLKWERSRLNDTGYYDRIKINFDLGV